VEGDATEFLEEKKKIYEIMPFYVAKAGASLFPFPKDIRT